MNFIFQNAELPMRQAFNEHWKFRFIIVYIMGLTENCKYRFYVREPAYFANQLEQLSKHQGPTFALKDFNATLQRRED